MLLWLHWRRNTYRRVALRELNRRLETIDRNEDPDPLALEALKGDIYAYSVSTVCDKQELFWKRNVVNFRIGRIIRVVFSVLLQPVKRFLFNKVFPAYKNEKNRFRALHEYAG